MTRTYQGFVALRNAVEEMPPSGRIFTRPKIDRNTIMDAEFAVVPSMEVEEYIQERGYHIPSQISGKGYHTWLEAPTVQDIITDRMEMNPQAAIADIIDAVFYYAEYDAFKEDNDR